MCVLEFEFDRRGFASAFVEGDSGFFDGSEPGFGGHELVAFVVVLLKVISLLLFGL